MDLTKIFEAVILLLISIITYVIIPYVKRKTDKEDYEMLEFWVTKGVQAAEQLYKETGKGKEKKQYVIDFLASKGYSVDFDEIDNLIESAVFEMKGESK